MSRIGLTLGGGSAGTQGTLAIAHSPNAAAVLAFGAGAALASVIAALCSALPGIIAALGAKSVARIKAKAEADVARERTRQRTLLIEAGLGQNLDAAMNLLKLQPLDADVLMDPRFGDELLHILLPDPRVPCEPASGLAVMPARKPGAHPVGQQRTPLTDPASVV